MKNSIKLFLIIIVAIALVSSASAYYILFVRETFTNLAPNEPANFTPANEAVDISRTPQLRWTGSDPENDPLTYDVYFGTNNPPPKVVSNQTSTSYNPSTLEFDTEYFWKIVAWDNYNASTDGPINEFITAPNHAPNTPSSPHPTDEAQNRLYLCTKETLILRQ